MTRLKWETAEELNQALALRLKKLRKRRGLSQQQLSERSGVSYGSGTVKSYAQIQQRHL